MSQREALAAECRAIIASLDHAVSTRGIQDVDPVDLYDHAYGRYARSMWRQHKLGMLSALPLEALDLLFPAIRHLWARRRQHPICLAQAGLAYITLMPSKLLPAHHCLMQANGMLDQLMKLKTETVNGFGFGINLRWESKGGEVPPLTPCHTQTSYAYDFIEAMLPHRRKDKLEESLRAIALHTAMDYPSWLDEATGTLVTGYSCIDRRVVVNAMSYRAKLLLKAHARFGDALFLDAGLEALMFLIRIQRADGAWVYAPEEPFIDHYHTAFILKNLQSILPLVKDPSLKQQVQMTLERGTAYYLAHLFDGEGLPRPFSESHKPVPYQRDAYDMAEALGFCLQHGHEEKALAITRFLNGQMKARDGRYVFRYYPFLSFFLKGMAYWRYANSALFLATAKGMNHGSHR